MRIDLESAEYALLNIEPHQFVELKNLAWLLLQECYRLNGAVAHYVERRVENERNT